MSHRQQTIERMKGQDIVLAVQDTTMLDYTDHTSTEGIGLCSKKKYQKGLLVHSTLAIAPVEWLLLTSFSINLLEDAVEKINWYKQR